MAPTVRRSDGCRKDESEEGDEIVRRSSRDLDASSQMRNGRKDFHS